MRVDLNADAAESQADLALFPYLSSVNLACTGHAGDEALLRNALQLAAELGLGVGAHPGYPDRANFGRLELGLPAAEIEELVSDQLQFMGGIADDLGVAVTHVKAHGALYNRSAVDGSAARAVARAAAAFRPDIRLYLPAGPGFAKLAESLADLRVRPVGEGFPDRGYLEDGRLAPRDLPGALLADPALVADRALTMARGEPLATADGSMITFRAETLCLHGDNPSAAGNARAVRTRLQDAGFVLGGLS